MKTKLSDREKEVAILVAKGCTDLIISKQLFISRRRVGEIIFNIKQKWKVHSRVEIGVLVYHYGLSHLHEADAMKEVQYG